MAAATSLLDAIQPDVAGMQDDYSLSYVVVDYIRARQANLNSNSNEIQYYFQGVNQEPDVLFPDLFPPEQNGSMTGIRRLIIRFS